MQSIFEDTITAPATIPGTGAISLIRISGENCFNIVDKLFEGSKFIPSKMEHSTIRYALIKDENSDIVDEVMLSVFKAPKSYTGEDMVEICCHASSYIVSEILRLLIKNGARAAEAGEFTKRAFVNGKMDLAQAESVADLIAASSQAAHRLAINQLRGGISKELKSLRGDLLNLSALLELELDFSEEDVEFADRKKLKGLALEIIKHLSKLSNSFKLGNAIRQGYPVAIVGPANAGKSTLLNSLVGDQRAIVSDIAGTTRDSIEEVLNINGILFRFIDTAGIRESDDIIENIGIDRSFEKLGMAQSVILMIDPSKDSPIQAIEQVLSKIDFDNQYLFLILNKADQFPEDQIKDFKTDFSERLTKYLSNRFGDNFEKAKDYYKLLALSAQDEEDIRWLKNDLFEIAKKRIGSEDQSLISNIRHYEALIKTEQALSSLVQGIDSKYSPDILAEDLRAAINHISSIIGEISNDEILSNIFANFCIGK